MTHTLLRILNTVYYVVYAAIIARVILSWIDVPARSLRDIVERITDPIMRPLRRLIPISIGAVDFTPFIAILLLMLVYRVLVSLVLMLG